jgi:hypothetical protein
VGGGGGATLALPLEKIMLLRGLLGVIAMVLLTTCALPGCASTAGRENARRGDEIVVAGRYFHTGAPVVLWTDPGGYDAYRTEKRFAKWSESAWRALSPEGKTSGHPETPARYNTRFAPAADGSTRQVFGDGPLSQEELDRVRGGGWDLSLVQDKVDQFVIHYDVCGT